MRCWALLVVIFFVEEASSYQCDRLASTMTKPSDPNAMYVIEVSGNPTNYVPGESYIITLKNNASLSVKGRFIDFELIAESANTDPLQFFSPPSAGSFHLIDPMLTRFSARCRSTVVHTNTVPKPSVQVQWIAPPPNSGCVNIKATVVESPEVWFGPDDGLTRFLCEETSQDADVQSPPLETCCACDEAKYEVAFQGMWSRNTHPKDFPGDIWQTKFSDIIGASHQINKSFWNYGDFATPGLKDFAERGNTTTLETELKEMSDNLRTIIKARELTYPDITGTSYTVFRADKQNHLVSLVSKITPSPDWIVGVANLELCLDNCSWVASRTLNLYPWDVGTDNSVTYTDSGDYPLKPDMIKMIKSNSPNDPKSPFFSDEGDQIKPLAKLHITREKLYEKDCENDSNDGRCATSKWSKWSSCASNCFKIRTREYLNPAAQEHCYKSLRERKACKSHQCGKEEQFDENDPRCELGEWSEWSSCSATCGKGTRTRDRQFKDESYSTLCVVNGEAPAVQENEECEGVGNDCENVEETTESDCPSTWGDWSPCNVSCGNGTKTRYREAQSSGENDEEAGEEGPCANQKHEEVVECYNPPCEDTSENPFGSIDPGNQVISTTPLVVEEGPTGVVIDCKVSKWSIWSPCNTTEPCKKGYKFRYRQIKVHAQNGGKACPGKLMKKKRCRVPCPETSTTPLRSDDEDLETRPSWGPGEDSRKLRPVNCLMGPWSAWSPCTNSCGSAAVQIKTRLIEIYPKNGGKPCGARKMERKCPLPIACTDGGRLPIFK